ncbi:MAG: alpha amylase C-terminal domain-containing protein [Chitinophagaceae bacterium]
MRDICHLYRHEPALYEKQFSEAGFEWHDLTHRDECVMIFRRMGEDPEEDLLIVLNMTPVVRWDWKIKIKGKSEWKEIFNSDNKKYWGTGDVYNPDIKITSLNKKENYLELNVHLPALAAIVLK